jgi:hypothetical protein
MSAAAIARVSAAALGICCFVSALMLVSFGALGGHPLSWSGLWVVPAAFVWWLGATIAIRSRHRLANRALRQSTRPDVQALAGILLAFGLWQVISGTAELALIPLCPDNVRHVSASLQGGGVRLLLGCVLLLAPGPIARASMEAHEPSA